MYALKPLLLLYLSAFSAIAAPCCSSCKKGHVCEPQKTSDKMNKGSTVRYPKLLVFVSFAMPIESLKALTKQVNTLGGAVVFRGLVEGSFHKTALKLKELGCEATVDPTLFEAYQVTAVPTFVLRERETNDAEKKVTFDRISGNVSLAYALEEFASKGDAQSVAKVLLQKLQEKR